MSISTFVWNDLSADARFELLERPAASEHSDIRATVEDIIERVKQRGDSAVREFSARLDGVELADFKVSSQEIDAASNELTTNAILAIDTAIENVSRFHERQRQPALSVETMPGVVCERLTHAIDAVGLYVPAGTAPLPSAAIMLAVPAAIAGCPVRVLCTPPRADGSADPAVIVAATRAGVDDIYKVGGAQAIAAMAYGTESIPDVHKICGPGNAWVTCAKSLVSTDPGGAAIDLPAGPSEVLVIADGTANAAFVASDLLSQAEHGADSQVILVTDSAAFAKDVKSQLASQLDRLSRKQIASDALTNSRIILVDSIAAAIAISNRYAPEHLILQCDGARDLVDDIRNAGSVFVGPWTPESVGDYCSGTNHVLPTYGYARSYSGLGVDQFVRAMTVQQLSREGLQSLSETVTLLAGLEGLDAHAAAVSIRLESSP